MKLSTKGRYGVKAMVDLAIRYGGNPVSIKSIAERQNLSEFYLEQLFAPLRRAKLIKSIRGAQGGYVLNRPPKDITVADIINVLEGPIEISSCLDKAECDNMDICPTRLLWEKIKKSIDDVTNSITLQDMADDYNNMIMNRSENHE
ncbi:MULTISPECIES: RrF2 family transcriptional regulator [Clostridium]|jgi:Rrf2 family transcriptional regulator, cysteine metabolism repressor|uniref:HTH-type transcriptional regulator CymR n=2 Tax=Clostridium TaxID=1485 RepID=A0A151AQX5_9CLOT|nr:MULTISPECIES: Rrf2 family transcriptional regulator [Clostridium]KYH29983.1 HTH-type transcriptional regulator CymR [Clostridium colicanis DSM 13634]MBE6044190.1 Rrf2 family transcriptional regulator [Clostridium thermopalmarium]PRR75920.1 HTH-type transcriptional regulator CymR [Clostridium thermopalmarium DSM 5974]PVZ24497.1 BadM/Rrf2 family transcriptional regulator [Clostridium thermopalmarium DSM 5974]